MATEAGFEGSNFGRLPRRGILEQSDAARQNLRISEHECK